MDPTIKSDFLALMTEIFGQFWSISCKCEAKNKKYPHFCQFLSKLGMKLV